MCLQGLRDAQNEIHGGAASQAGGTQAPYVREQRRKKRLQAHIRKLAAAKQNTIS